MFDLLGPCSEGLRVRLYRDKGKENGNYYNGDSIGVYNIDVYSFDVALVVWECVDCAKPAEIM